MMMRGHGLMEGTAGKRGVINDTLRELLIGILAAGAMFQAAGVWFVKNRVSYSAGLWIGTGLALFLAWHMWKSIDEALDLGETGAQKRMRGQAAFRYLVIVMVLAVLMYTEGASPLAAFLGVMSLKVAAYLQPVTHKVILKLRR